MKLRKPYRAGRNSFFKGVLFGIIMKIILRKDALSLALKKYYTGKLCKRDHLSERRTCNGHCIECNKEDLRSCKRKIYEKEYRKAIKYKTYQKTESYKEIQKKAQEKTRLKFLNAHRSRRYYSDHKHKISILSICEKCKSDTKVEAHHHDYNLPLEVTFLCKACHEEWHINNTPLNRVTGIFTEAKP